MPLAKWFSVITGLRFLIRFSGSKISWILNPKLTIYLKLNIAQEKNLWTRNLFQNIAHHFYFFLHSITRNTLRTLGILKLVWEKICCVLFPLRWINYYVARFANIFLNMAVLMIYWFAGLNLLYIFSAISCFCFEALFVRDAIPSHRDNRPALCHQ